MLINKEQACFWIINSVWHCEMFHLLMVVGYLIIYQWTSISWDTRWYYFDSCSCFYSILDLLQEREEDNLSCFVIIWLPCVLLESPHGLFGNPPRHFLEKAMLNAYFWYCHQIWMGICPALWLYCRSTRLSHKHLYPFRQNIFDGGGGGINFHCICFCNCFRDQNYACGQKSTRNSKCNFKYLILRLNN